VGRGYYGGYWQGGRFAYNRAVTNVNINVVHNVYNYRVTNVTNTRVSYNGGPGGINIRPNANERAVIHEQRMAPVAAQNALVRQSAANRAQFASANRGRPAEIALQKPLQTEYRAPAARPDAVAGHPRVFAPAPRPEAGRPGSVPQTDMRAQTRQEVRPEPSRPTAPVPQRQEPVQRTPMPQQRPEPAQERARQEPFRPAPQPAPQPAQRMEAPRPGPQPAQRMETPRPQPAQRMEPGRPAPQPAQRMETPRPQPAQRVEPGRPAPQQRMEAPRPQPAPRTEMPRPAPRVEPARPQPAPRVEAPRPAPAQRPVPPPHGGPPQHEPGKRP
jgi:hypothetical protein